MEPDPILDYSTRSARPMPVGETPVLTGRQLAALACRVIALWMAANTVQDATRTVYQFLSEMYSLGAQAPHYFATPFLGLLVVIGPILAGVALWLLADRLAARMMRDESAAVPAGGPGYPGLLSVGLTVAGAIVTVPAARNLASAVAGMVHQHHEFSAWWHDAAWLRSFWSSAVGLLLGTWLLFGGRGVANLIVRARTAGVRHDAAGQPD